MNNEITSHCCFFCFQNPELVELHLSHGNFFCRSRTKMTFGCGQRVAWQMAFEPECGTMTDSPYFYVATSMINSQESWDMLQCDSFVFKKVYTLLNNAEIHSFTFIQYCKSHYFRPVFYSPYESCNMFRFVSNLSKYN